jgi:sugar/nucleoside kinase (ribokinase family)
LDTLQGVHMAGRGHKFEGEVVAAVADSGTTLSLEPILEKGDSRQRWNAILDLLPYVDIFSPGLTDAYWLLGERPVAELLAALADKGPRFVILRRGAVGSLVYDRVADRTWQVPAARANVVDVTGAGNAYCGGFLAGWGEYGSVEQAAACAAVSAALTIEQIGPPAITPALLAAAKERQVDCLAEICEGVEQIV